MEPAGETKLSAAQHYSPTSTPVLDVFRPLPAQSKENLSAGEYFLVCGLAILASMGLSSFRALIATVPAYWAALIPLVAALSAGFVHEAGHFLSGLFFGFKITQIKIGPLQWGGRTKCHEPYCNGVIALGVMMLEPKSADQKDTELRRRLSFLLLGGPIAGFMFAGIAELALVVMQPGLKVVFGMHVVAEFSLVLAIAALLPDVNRRGNFSDGARMLMLLRNDGKAERWVSNIRCQMALNQGRHPRDWDESSVSRAATIHDDSRDAYIANWLAYLWAAERQDITCATKYLEGALESLAYSTPRLRDHLFLEAAIFQAWFRDNPSKALFWVYRIRSKKLTQLQKTRLDVALLWAEGRLFDAWEKLGTGYLTELAGFPASAGRTLAEESAAEWKRQMESRMLTRAWRSMYSLSRQLEPAALQEAFAAQQS